MALLERDDELALMSAALKRARTGSGRLVVVEGAAGNGKSALVAELMAQTACDGFRVLRARGTEMESDFAFGAIRQLFEAQVLHAAPAERDALLAGAAAPAGCLLVPGLPGLHRDDEPGNSTPESFLIYNAIYWLAVNLAQESPLALVVDDLHWVDRPSVGALTYLAHRLDDVPVVLLVALRPDEPATPSGPLAGVRFDSEAVVIRLGALRLRSVSQIVRATVPDAADDLCAACFSATGGNPFYLRELLLTIADAGPGRPTPVVEAIALPTLGERLMRRLGHIGPGAVALARAMSVIGDGGKVADAASLAGMDEATATRAVAFMRRIEVLTDANPFTFAHPLVRRSLYQTLSATERDAMHRAAADRLAGAGESVQVIAAHLALVRPAGRSATALALYEAATDAAHRGAPDTAARLLERARQEGAAQPPRAELLHALGRVELAARSPSSITHLQEALDGESDPVRRARIALDLIVILDAAGQWDASVTVIAQAFDSLQGRDREVAIDLETLWALQRANDPRMIGGYDADRDRLLKLTTGESWSCRALAVLMANIQVFRGQSLERARRLLAYGLRDWKLFAEHDAGSWASAQALHALVLLDDDDRALEAIDQLRAYAERAAALVGTLTAMGYRASVSARRGNLAMAEAEMRPPLDISIQNGLTLFVATAAALLVDPILERPSLDDVADALDQADIPSDFRATSGGAMLLEARGRWRVARGERDRGIADLRACAEVYAALGFGPPLSHWRSALATALPAAAREEALDLVGEELRRSAATGLVRAHGVSLHRAGLVSGGPRGLEQLSAAASALTGSHARLETARALVDYGAALRRGGFRADGRRYLGDGLDLACRCNADRLVLRALEEMRVCGGRPRRLTRTGIDALTPSELRTVRLVADGRSNAEVAQALFVSLKTVETHLMHAYPKLGLAGPGSRQALAALVDPTLQ